MLTIGGQKQPEAAAKYALFGPKMLALAIRLLNHAIKCIPDPAK
ncbi:hypothetical protein BRAO375_540012 [Bradyrhizobium sp. ORS 375]|nr:hypothetical protein BRAO375_540012 [Bradyrhizobium sp. ORS 375]